MTSLATIKEWYDRGDDGTHSHMVVMCDTFDYEDYPMYVTKGEDPRERASRNADKVMECYSYALGWDVQSKQFRAQNWDF